MTPNTNFLYLGKKDYHDHINLDNCSHLRYNNIRDDQDDPQPCNHQSHTSIYARYSHAPPKWITKKYILKTNPNKLKEYQPILKALNKQIQANSQSKGFALIDLDTGEILEL